MLERAGFSRLVERAIWAEGAARPGQGGTVIAWATASPAARAASFRLVAAHADSPNLPIRPQPDIRNLGFRQLSVGVYREPLGNSWLDRELGITGRVVLANPDREVRLIRVGRPLLRIPQLDSHLDREALEAGLKLNRQTQLVPIRALDGPDAPGFLKFLAEELQLSAAPVISRALGNHDLVLIAIAGARGEFVSAPRPDNLGSTNTVTRALIEHVTSEAVERIAVIRLFDHEEVGSMTSSGAACALLPLVLERIVLADGAGRGEIRRGLADSVGVSADLAHAVNPNYQKRYGPRAPTAAQRGARDQDQRWSALRPPTPWRRRPSWRPPQRPTGRSNAM